MDKLDNYIKKCQIFEQINEELSKEEQGNNVLIDSTENYNLYCGKHLFDRQNRDVEHTYNIGDKIPLKYIKDTIKKGFYHIDNCFTSDKIKENDPFAGICITNKKYFQDLNIIVFVKKLEKDGIYDLIIKTVMFKNGFGSELKRYINEELFENLIFVEI